MMMMTRRRGGYAPVKTAIIILTRIDLSSGGTGVGVSGINMRRGHRVGCVGVVGG